MTAPTPLEALELRARACRACGLRSGCSQVVAGEGHSAAPLLILGKAPGGDEDRLGRPFVGQAGELLDRMLAAVDLTRQDAYVTTMVRCRPPGDRTPHPHEVAVCTSLWLEPQLDRRRPRVILALGNTAAQFLLQTRRGITRLRGTWHPYRHGQGPETSLVMPLFHPAYLVHHDSRAPGDPRSLTWRDLREVAAVLRGEKEPEGLVGPLPPALGDQPPLF